MVSNSFGVVLSSNALLTVVRNDPLDEEAIRAVLAALKNRAEAHDLDGFMALFSADYMHSWNDRAALRRDLQDGLSAVQSFIFSIDHIKGAGSNATVFGSCTVVFNDGQSPASWVEPDAEGQGLGLGWLRKTTPGWQIIGNQERASVRVETGHVTGPSLDFYRLNLTVESSLAINGITVSGHSITTTSMDRDPESGGFSKIFMILSVGGLPPVGAAYSFDVQFADGTHQILRDTVKS